LIVVQPVFVMALVAAAGDQWCGEAFTSAKADCSTSQHCYRFTSFTPDMPCVCLLVQVYARFWWGIAVTRYVWSTKLLCATPG